MRDAVHSTLLFVLSFVFTMLNSCWKSNTNSSLSGLHTRPNTHRTFPLTLDPPSCSIAFSAQLALSFNELVTHLHKFMPASDKMFLAPLEIEIAVSTFAMKSSTRFSQCPNCFRFFFPLLLGVMPNGCS